MPVFYTILKIKTNNFKKNARLQEIEAFSHGN